MKITKIETFEVDVPFVHPAIGEYLREHSRGTSILLIKVHTDEGVVGLGEGGHGQVGYGERFSAQIPAWIGKDPFAENLAEMGAPMAAALYDIVGKALAVPACRLMGAKYRDRVPVGYWSCYMKPEETARETEVAVKKGFTNHKLKARPWDIVQQCELISQVGGPQFSITVDPNMTFETLGATIGISRQLEKYNILCLEDPIDWSNWNQFRLLRQKQDIPIAPHLGKPSDVLNALKAEAADLFNVGGSFANIQRCAALAEAAGLPTRFQVGGLTVGIAGAWETHVGAAIRNATQPNDLHYFLREHDLLVDSPLTPVDGYVPVPEGPGLGVELDEKMLEKYRTG